jgi:hypothetical protein
MSKQLGILTSASSARKADLIRNVVYWCEQRSISYRLIPETVRLERDEVSQLGALYKPLTLGSLTQLQHFPCDIPIIMDFVGLPASAKSVAGTGSILQGRRVALRNAFGAQHSHSPIEFQVPYMARPLCPSSSSIRNVIVFDVKPFHSLATQAAVLELLADIAANLTRLEEVSGTKLTMYLTSFMPWKVYRDAIQAFVDCKEVTGATTNPLDLLHDALLPPAVRPEDYESILKRARLFITEHGDLADVDLLQAGSLGVPILLYNRSAFAATTGIQHLVKEGAIAIDARFENLLIDAERRRMRREWGYKRIFQIEKVEPWPYEILESVFLRGWDMLWDWALHGSINEKVNEAMRKPRKWNKGLRTHARGYEFVHNQLT